MLVPLLKAGAKGIAYGTLKLQEHAEVSHRLPEIKANTCHDEDVM